MRFEFLAQRLFNTPLAIHPSKVEVILAALSERLGLTQIRAAADSDALFSKEGRNPEAGYELVEGIAVIEVQGTLVNKLRSPKPSDGMTGYDGIRTNILAALDDPAVKAIALDIDSPGGEVSGCFDLVDTIYHAREIKPIHAILSESAYSAAYAIASAADIITVPRTGGTGSVGVISVHMEMSEAIKKGGLNVTIVRHGARKAEGNPYEPLSDQALTGWQKDVNEVGLLFAQTVARNRGLSVEQVLSWEARTFQGAEGVSVGLADQVCAPDAAFFQLIEKVRS